MLVECGRLVERETVWFLREVGMPLDIAEVIGHFGQGVGTLAARLESFLSPADCELLEQRSAQFVAEGAPQALARRIAGLALLAPACDIVRIAATLQLPVEQVRSEEHTSELQSLMRISYAVFCLKQNNMKRE